MAGNVVTGAGYFFRGLAMLPKPGIRLFVLIPLLANIVVFLTIGSLVFGYISDATDWLTEFLPEFLSFLSWLLSPLLWLISGLMTGYVATFIVLLFTSPFHALLAEKVEEQITGEELPAIEGVMAALAEVPRGILREIAKLGYYLPRALGLLVLTFIPGINAFSPLLWFLFGAWMMSLQYIDYPMDNHRLRLKDVREACSSRRMSSMGFGGMVAIVAGIPLVNMVVIPAAVIGATLLWCDEMRPAVLPREPARESVE